MITSEQCRAGRAVLNWSQSDLAKESGVSLRSIQEFEANHRNPNLTTLQGLLAALERNGIVLPQNGASLEWGRLRGITIDPRKIGKVNELE
jgi:transcriptional regulator with XRE-family HTH domain